MPPSPHFLFLATPLPALVVGEESLVIGFGPPHFRNASAIAGRNATRPQRRLRQFRVLHVRYWKRNF